MWNENFVGMNSLRNVSNELFAIKVAERLFLLADRCGIDDVFMDAALMSVDVKL